MNIGQAARQSGLSAKTVRYYEEVGLVVPARCTGNDYRDYSPKNVECLRFLQCARVAGFSLEVCRELLTLYCGPTRHCPETKAMVIDKIHQIEEQIKKFNSLRLVLTVMADNCSRADSTEDSTNEAQTQPASTLMPFTLVEY